MLIETLENVLNRGLPRSPSRAAAVPRARRTSDGDRSQRLYATSSRRAPGTTLKLTRVTCRRHTTPFSLPEAGVRSSGSHGNRAATDIEAEIVGGPLSLLALGRRSAGSRAPARRRADPWRRGAGAEVSRAGDAAAAGSRRRSLPGHRRRARPPARAPRRAAFGWTRNATSTTVRNVAEYLAHERQHLVPRAEGDQLLKGVDTLRENVDRTRSPHRAPDPKDRPVNRRVLLPTAGNPARPAAPWAR